MSEQEQDTTTRGGTTTEELERRRVRWEVEFQVIAPQGVDLQPLIPAFTALQAEALQELRDPRRATESGSGRLAERLEQALYSANEGPLDFGSDADGARIVGFNAIIRVVLRAPDGEVVAETEEPSTLIGLEQIVNDYRPRVRAGQGSLERRAGRKANVEGYALDVWVWRPAE